MVNESTNYDRIAADRKMNNDLPSKQQIEYK